MRSSRYDVIIIGGGFYGCRIALHWAARKSRVLIIERNPDIIGQASYNNQARVHGGYHYPRNVLTALRSRVNFPLFVEEYADCIDKEVLNYYAVARHLSKVTASQYERFCQRIGAEIRPASDKIKRLFDSNYIEEVFSVAEHTFNPDQLRECLLQQLGQAGVEVQLNSTVTRISGDLDVGYLNDDDAQQVSGDTVFNCTYSQINVVNEAAGVPLIEFKHELTEMALVNVPDELRQIGITVMCGPFFSCVPFPAKDVHTLTHVRYTPRKSWTDEPGYCPGKGYEIVDEARHKSAFGAMVRDAKRYLPLAEKFTRAGSLIEIKTVLPANEDNDGRPILFRRNHGLKNYHCVMGGKIDNVYDVLKELESLNV